MNRIDGESKVHAPGRVWQMLDVAQAPAVILAGAATYPLGLRLVQLNDGIVKAKGHKSLVAQSLHVPTGAATQVHASSPLFVQMVQELDHHVRLARQKV